MMRKILIAGLIVCSLSAQAKFLGLSFGVKVMPLGSWNSVNQVPNLSSGSLTARYGFGAFVDLNLTSFLALELGANYITLGSQITAPQQVSPTVAAVSSDLNFNLSYLQIPLTVKVYTPPVLPLTRLYFQAGASLDLNTASSITSSISNSDYQNNPGKYISTFNSNFIGALGAEVNLKIIRVFGGFIFKKGILNALTSNFRDPVSNQNITMTNNAVGLELGVRF